MQVSGIEIAAILFDLDNTLVDRDAVVCRLESSLYSIIQTSDRSVDEGQFVEEFVRIDAGGSIPDKRQQMGTVIQDLSLIETNVDKLKAWWDDEYPGAFVLEPETRELLNRLTELEVPCGIVSNGSPLQVEVIRASGLNALTDVAIVSSLADLRKPDRVIFELAMSRVDADDTPEKCLFVGDNPTADIVGAVDAGMRTAWVSRGSEWPLDDRRPDIVIESIGDLMGLIDS